LPLSSVAIVLPAQTASISGSGLPGARTTNRPRSQAHRRRHWTASSLIAKAEARCLPTPSKRPTVCLQGCERRTVSCVWVTGALEQQLGDDQEQEHPIEDPQAHLGGLCVRPHRGDEALDGVEQDQDAAHDQHRPTAR
jgi:hypothetical protein